MAWQGQGESAAEDWPRKSIWQLVDETAARSPQQVLFEDDRGRRMTVAGLRDAALGVAAFLHDQGVTEGTRVMWQLPTSIETAVLTVALNRLGAVQNPLITMLRAGEIGYFFREFGFTLAVVPTEWRGFGHAEAVRASVGSSAEVLVCDHHTAPADGLALPSGNPAGLPPVTSSTHPRWLYTTSGTTAAPKGVWHTDASVWAAADTMVEQYDLTGDDLFPMAFPYAHIGGLLVTIAALRTGLRVLLMDNFDPVQSPLLMAERGATILGSATPFFNAYLAAQRAQPQRRLFERLRYCIGGGAPVFPGLHGRIRAELGGAGLSNGYGLTEFPMLGNPPIDDQDAMAASAWRPASRVRVRVVGPDGADVPDGEEGELRVNGPQRFTGYLDPRLDTNAVDESGFVRTGDLARRGADGLITLTGRIKEIIVRNGENISMTEVETVLAEHPAVAEVALMAVPDPQRGEIGCALVIPAPGCAVPTLESLQAHCAAAGLARYKTPERVQEVNSIPRNAMGKINRHALEPLVTAVDTASPHP